MNLLRYAEHLLRVARYSRQRYRHLFTLIAQSRARTILEIGTWNGRHAREMIRTAAIWHPASTIEYFGFDLFEHSTPEDLEREFTPKVPPSEAEVRRRLAPTGAAIQLFKGYTRDTLAHAAARLPPIDFAFIDGGHSVETVRDDWGVVQRLVRPGALVVFDDYYQEAEPLQGLGCGPVVAGIDRSHYAVEVLEPADEVPQPWGTLQIRMVCVRPLAGTQTVGASRDVRHSTR